MTRAQLEALAARVEAAQGADDALWNDVCVAVGWQQDPIALTWKHVDEPLVTRCFPPPRYLTSIDAAASLVPEGHYWALVMQGAGKTFEAFCAGGNVPMKWHRAATPALALTAAALRARAMEARDAD